MISFLDIDTNNTNHFHYRSIVNCISRVVAESEEDIRPLSVLTDATTQKISLKKYIAKECNAEVRIVLHCYFWLMLSLLATFILLCLTIQINFTNIAKSG